MKARLAILAALSMFMVLTATPAHLHGAQATPAQHEEHHIGPADAPGQTTAPGSQGNMMATMMASDAKLDALVNKMNTAEGAAKTDAIAELLTALVQEHHTMRTSMMANMSNMSMMSNMMNMMNMMQMMNMMPGMGGMGGRGDAGPTAPKK